jgi:hypothetical protein
MDEYDGWMVWSRRCRGKPQYEIKARLIQNLSDLWAIWKSYGSRITPD